MLEEAKPPTGGVAIDAIAREVAPVLPLLSELPAEQRVSGDYESFQFRECLTVLTLLGRRLALLDLTPTAAVQVVRLALRVADEGEERSPTRFAERAAAAAIEGFVLGREERVLHLQRQESAATVRPIRVEEKIFALLPAGVHEPEVLTEHVDALGRAMLDADADIAIVDLSQLGGIDREPPPHDREQGRWSGAPGRGRRDPADHRERTSHPRVVREGALPVDRLP